MQAIAERILRKTRKGLFRSWAVFKAYEPVTSAEIHRIEEIVGAELPQDLAAWLLVAGYGDVDDVLSFRSDWFHAIEQGHLAGAVIFAQDDLGNFYGYWPPDGKIYFFYRSSPEYALAAPSFRSFMDEFESRDFKLQQWMDNLPHQPYERDA